MQVAPGIIVGGKYQVEEPLARGGMGSVWVARHTKLGSAVAIKFLDAHLAAAPALVARFEREARAAANLQTPHVVHVHDYGVEDGTPYLVMELLRGEDLNTRIRKRGRLPLPEAAAILSQMARALRRAHEAGIVHRDLKPANVFLARVDDDEVVKILDFGIAKETWSRVDEATKTGEVFGSPHYMSPEQARAERDVDPRADVWATGVILYRMLTGRLPFPGEALGTVLSSVLVDPAPPVSEVAPDLPAALDGFFARALAKKKEERFSSIGDLAQAFGAIVADPGAPARPADTSATAPTLAAPDAVQAPAPGRASLPSAPGVQVTTAAPARHPAIAPAQAAPAPAAEASMTIDTSAPTQLYRRSDPRAELLPAPSPPAPVEKTGGSIVGATSSLPPSNPFARRSRAPWVAGGVAACVFALGAWALMSSGAPAGSGEAQSAAPGTADVLNTASTSPASTAPAAAPSGDPAPGTPVPAGSTVAPVASASPSVTASAEASAPIRAAAPVPAPAKQGSGRPAAPATAPAKPAAPRPTAAKKPIDWGL